MKGRTLRRKRRRIRYMGRRQLNASVPRSSRMAYLRYGRKKTMLVSSAGFRAPVGAWKNIALAVGDARIQFISVTLCADQKWLTHAKARYFKGDIGCHRSSLKAEW